MMSSLCLFLFASAMAPAAQATPALTATATVNVLVTDRRGNPLRSAHVVVNGSEHQGVTNSSGRVVFTNMKPGEYMLRVERDQYITFEKDFVVSGQQEPIPVVAAISPLASLAARPARKLAGTRVYAAPQSARTR